jgi:hypothetical protein
MDYLLLSESKIERELEKMRKNITFRNSKLALCGNCRYTDEMAEFYLKTSYPFCECRYEKRILDEVFEYRGICIMYNPENKDYSDLYFRELLSNIDNITNNLLKYKKEIPSYKIFTKRKIRSGLWKFLGWSLSITNMLVDYYNSTPIHKRRHQKQFHFRYDSSLIPRNV